MIVLIPAAQMLPAQHVYTINADSTRLTGCDSNELIIGNHTQNVNGFLYNTGNGRTVFRKGVIKLNDSISLIGQDTLYTYWKANGSSIYNTNSGKVGIHRTAPKVLLDLPGPISIDDTSSYRINYHPMLRVNAPSGNSYANLFVGDSAGYAWDGSIFNTMVGHLAGTYNAGSQVTLVGYQAGYMNKGIRNTFLGYASGQNNASANSSYSYNTFLGCVSGMNNIGSANTFTGYYAGYGNNGSGNTAIGYSSDAFGVGSNNAFYGYAGGSSSHGDGNSIFGYQSGSANQGSLNVLMGTYSGYRNVGSNNVFVGSYTGLADSNYPNGNIRKVTLLGDSADVGTTLVISNSTALGNRAVVKASNTMVFGDTAVNSWLFNTNAVAAPGKALVVGSNASNGNGAYLTTGGVWTNASDKWKKENFQSLDNGEVLQKIRQLPITRWNYIGLSEQHIGPVAQDFYDIFHLGKDDKTISTIDPAGIALAGIQGLYDKIQKQEVQIEEFKDCINRQNIQLATQQSLLNRMMEQIQQLRKQMDEQARKGK